MPCNCNTNRIRERQQSCFGLILSILSVILAFTVGIIIGAALFLIVLPFLAVLVAFAIIILILIILLLIFRRCRCEEEKEACADEAQEDSCGCSRGINDADRYRTRDRYLR
jgi:membrane protein implicated in regulation of membrane protease activity